MSVARFHQHGKNWHCQVCRRRRPADTLATEGSDTKYNAISEKAVDRHSISVLGGTNDFSGAALGHNMVGRPVPRIRAIAWPRYTFVLIRTLIDGNEEQDEKQDFTVFTFTCQNKLSKSN